MTDQRPPIDWSERASILLTLIIWAVVLVSVVCCAWWAIDHLIHWAF